jgi:dihydroorotate dehydrogenase, subfamily 2
MYKFIRRILFLLPAETAHTISMGLLKLLCAIPLFRSMIRRLAYSTSKPVTFLGINFPNAIGLGAGFDKNAKYLRELQTLGFGFIEIGTVTPRPQKGNDKPRLFRLVNDNALINRMGFNNEGVEEVAKRLKKWRKKEQGNQRSDRFIIGGNIGKNKNTPNEEAWKDYEICFRTLHHYVDFFVVNVSSPNTPGLRALQDKDSLKIILTRLQKLNTEIPASKPILLKIAPDLTWTQIDDVIDLANEINLDGLVATNTTIERSGLITSNEIINQIGNGGLSGKPLRERSTEIVSYIKQKENRPIPIIASGGIFNAEDAKEKFAAGASLIEVWTGFIYEGPFIVRKITSLI